MISASEEALRNLNNSINIFILASVQYTLGVMLIILSTGEFPSRNLMNSISCGTPDISVIFTVFSSLNVQSVGHSFPPKSKSEASVAADVFEEPCTNQ